MTPLPSPAVRFARSYLGGIARALQRWERGEGLARLPRRGLAARIALLRREGMALRYARELRAVRVFLATRGAHLPGDSARCGARTRRGGPCAAWPVCGSSRCRMHGGASTGPKTAEGRARALANLRRGSSAPARR